MGAVKLRSMLVVPADQPDRMADALRCGADALILDLYETVGAAARSEARRMVAEFLSLNPSSSLWVRINPLASPEADRDLAAIVPGRPDGIVLPNAEGGVSVVELARRLTERGNISAMILPLASQTPGAIFQLGTYAGVKRLAALGWSPDRLGEALGAAETREADGRHTPPFELARSLCLFGAGAAGVPAIDCGCCDEDEDGLRAHAQRARRDGFTGMVALAPGQLPVIREVFAAGA
jgi:citrate lyase subunit beta / citryl-CoA lyase